MASQSRVGRQRSAEQRTGVGDESAGDVVAGGRQVFVRQATLRVRDPVQLREPCPAVIGIVRETLKGDHVVGDARSGVANSRLSNEHRLPHVDGRRRSHERALSACCR